MNLSATEGTNDFAAPRPGDTLGKYLLVRVIGEGGMGVVYEALHVALNRRVALKILSPEVLQHEGVYDRFVREARITSQIRSPHVVAVFDIDETAEGLPYLVLELLEGRDLADVLDEGPITTEAAIDYVRQALAGLGEAHALGIIHRDLKPANLFICNAEPGERSLVKLLDFGISKADDDRRTTRTTDSFGTPDYMSPEQIRATRDVDGRADIWSMGIVLFECLTRRTPFDGASTNVIASIVADPILPLRGLRPDLPEALEAAVNKALTKDPTQRYQTVDEFYEALTRFAPDLLEPFPTTAYDDEHLVLGSLLVQSGLVTEEVLRRALEQQRETGKRLGDCLVAMGACTPAQITETVEAQINPQPASGRMPARTLYVARTVPALSATSRERGKGATVQLPSAARTTRGPTRRMPRGLIPAALFGAITAVASIIGFVVARQPAPAPRAATPATALSNSVAATSARPLAPAPTTMVARTGPGAFAPLPKRLPTGPVGSSMIKAAPTATATATATAPQSASKINPEHI